MSCVGSLAVQILVVMSMLGVIVGSFLGVIGISGVTFGVILGSFWGSLFGCVFGCDQHFGGHFWCHFLGSRFATSSRDKHFGNTFGFNL